ncbi:tape measure protein [uncultured Azohydromonas sp.]|jgi:tape measure domain|uniref:tape measure protein n=1 Tax=uncultured Azohydromonas sp. TaxID=487342 RepID=UPI002611BCAA|nr:tape measure protein [uncultured Azohydromonas sp.]
MSEAAGTHVGGIFYTTTLDTQGLIDAQRRVDRELKKAAGSFDGVKQAGVGAMTAVATAVKVLAAAMVLVKSAEMADDMRLLAARVNIAAGSIQAGAEALRALTKISAATQTELESNVQVFARLNSSIKQMGGTQQDTLTLTELLAKAIKVSGVSAGEASAAMLQFGQALGSGKLAGDELKSLMETAPYLMKQLADGIGVPIGQLKSLGEQGKLTADVVVQAMSKAASSINADFAQMPETMRGAFTVAMDAAARANEKLDDLTGTSAALSGAGKGLGDILDFVAGRLAAMAGEGEKAGRAKLVQKWAEDTATVLSYVVDATDFVVRGFRQMGAGVAGLAASAGLAAQGQLGAARAALTQMKDDVLAIGGASYMGPRFRQQQAALKLTPEPDRLDRAAQAAPAMSKLKPPKDEDEARKAAAKTATAQAYYQGLVAANKTALEQIDAEEQKALTENQRRMLADKDNAAIYTKAKVEIIKKFAMERARLEEENTQQIADFNIQVTTDEATRIEAVRAEAVRRAEAAERLGTMTHEQAERAKTLATFKAEQERADLVERNTRARAEAGIVLAGTTERRILLIRNEAIRQAEEGYRRGALTFEEAEARKVQAAQMAIDQQKQLETQRTNVRLGTLQIKAEGGDPQAQEDAIRARAEADMAAVEQARLMDLEASQLYADQKVAIEQRMQQDIANLRSSAAQAQLAGASDLFGSLATIAAAGAGKQSGIYKAMFAASKAFAVAESIVKIQQGIANAAALPFPANIPAMASVAAATANIITTIQGVNYGGGRQYGGPASADTMYRVNETGRPEMFTAANGAQYLLPTSGGRVTSAADMAGAGAAPTVIINNNGQPLAVQRTTWDAQQQRMVIDMAVKESASQIAERRGPMWGALRTTNVQGRPG